MTRPLGPQHQSGSAETIGTMALIAFIVSVVALGAPGFFIHESEAATSYLRVDAKARSGSDMILLTHADDVPVDLGLHTVVVNVGRETLYDAPGGSEGTVWGIGETLSIGPLSRPLVAGESAEVTLIARSGSTSSIAASALVLPATSSAAPSAGLAIHALGLSDATPTDISATQNLLVRAATDHPDGRKVILSVTGELSGLVPQTALTDDGGGGDLRAGDGIFSAHMSVPVNALPGVYPVILTATDIDGGRATTYALVRVLTPALLVGELVLAPAAAPERPAPAAAQGPAPAASSEPSAASSEIASDPSPTRTSTAASPDLTPTPTAAPAPTPAPSPTTTAPPATTTPTSSPRFVILPDGGVSVTRDSDLNVSVIGSAITYGAGGPTIPVRVQFTQDHGTTLSTMFNNNPVHGGHWKKYHVPATSVVGIRGTASYLTVFNAAYNSYDHDPHVVVLKNGDTPPNVPAFGDQANVKAYLAPFIQNGVIKLTNDQVILLYEFDPSLSSSAADFQDLVVVFTFS